MTWIQHKDYVESVTKKKCKCLLKPLTKEAQEHMLKKGICPVCKLG